MIAEKEGLGSIEGNMDLDRIHYEGRKQWRGNKETESEWRKGTDCYVD